jgi:serine/threonine protein kinase
MAAAPSHPPAPPHTSKLADGSAQHSLDQLSCSTASLLKYDIGRELGRGKFSVVFKAVVKASRQTVAVKRIAIFDIMDGKARKKTLREVDLLRNCQVRARLLPAVLFCDNHQPHRNIIRYLDSFIDSNELYGRPPPNLHTAIPYYSDRTRSYIVFEWAELGDLRRMLKRRSCCYEEAVVWQLFGQICSAVAHLHAQRIM